MTKQEKIQEAYGVHWEQVKDFVDENGWVKDNSISWAKAEDLFEIQTYDFLGINGLSGGVEKWRHESLQGIEKNNGWIKIESESDLPKKDGSSNEYYKVGTLINVKFNLSNGEHEVKEVIKSFFEDKITHYQPIIKPKPPIY